MQPKKSFREKWKDRLFQAQIAYGVVQYGELKALLGFYPKYKAISGLCLIALTLFFFFTGQFMMALIAFGITHLHFIFNQMYWKLMTIDDRNQTNDETKNNNS